MKTTSLLAGAFFAVGCFVIVPDASAFCGATEASATARTAERASSLALKTLRREARSLKRQYGQKLVLEEPAIACKGGGVGIDANGNQTTGRPSCTATQAFCVNP